MFLWDMRLLKPYAAQEARAIALTDTSLIGKMKSKASAVSATQPQ